MLLREKLAQVEADIISAASHGPAAMHAEIFNKLAALDLSDPADLDAVIDGLYAEHDGSEAKFAAYGSPRSTTDSILRTVALGSFLAPPVVHIVKYMMDKQGKEDGWSNLMATAPGLIAQNPSRARMSYDLLHEAAPGIAKNTPLAADLIKQMTSMPQLDLGTIKGVSEIAKNLRRPAEDDVATKAISGLGEVPGAVEGYQHILTGKHASFLIPAAFKAADGRPTVFDWTAESVKAAGLTDAFSGPGTTMDQANNAFQMNQAEQGNTMLPLDSIVRELISKEQELMSREEMIAQQEQQLQQVMSQYQQMAQQYQGQTGVDPSTGQPAAPAPAEGAPAEDPNAAPAEGVPAEDPNAAPAEGAPAEDPNAAPAEGAPAEGPPSLEDPNAAPAEGAPAEGPPSLEDPNAAPAEGAPAEGPPSLEDPNAAPAEGESTEDPNAAPAPAEGAPTEDPNAAPPSEMAGSPEGDPNAAPPAGPDATDASGSAGDAAALDAMSQQAQPMPSADQVSSPDGGNPQEGPPADTQGLPPEEGSPDQGLPPEEGSPDQGLPPEESLPPGLGAGLDSPPPDMGQLPPDAGGIPPDMGQLPPDMGQLPPGGAPGEVTHVVNVPVRITVKLSEKYEEYVRGERQW